MNDKSTVLIVDDDLVNQEILSEALEEFYHLEYAGDGLECLAKVVEKAPDLILLDVAMPEMDGIETCQRLRANSEYCHLPILFLSALVSHEEKMRGYEAGGDDYICKPFDEGELLAKINLAIKHYHNRLEQEQTLKETSDSVMTTINWLGEQGNVIDFFRASFSTLSFDELCSEVFHLTQTFGLHCSLFIRSSQQGELYFSDDGSERPLELEFLNKINAVERFIELGPRAIFISDNALLLVRNMPVKDQELNGRLKDNLAIIIIAVQARVKALDMEQSILVKQNMLLDSVKFTKETLTVVEKNYKKMQLETSQIVSGISDGLFETFVTLDLNEVQEETLSQVVNNAQDGIDKLFRQGAALDTVFDEIVQRQVAVIDDIKGTKE